MNHMKTDRPTPTLSPYTVRLDKYKTRCTAEGIEVGVLGGVLGINCW
jgi:hypothetical protein